MMTALPNFARQTVIVQRATTATDGHGNEVRDWDSPDEHTLTNCLVAPGGANVGASLEVLVNRDEVLTDWSLYAPAGADLESTDRVLLSSGRTFEVSGPVMRYETGVLDHVQARLTLVEG